MVFEQRRISKNMCTTCVRGGRMPKKIRQTLETASRNGGGDLQVWPNTFQADLTTACRVPVLKQARKFC